MTKRRDLTEKEIKAATRLQQIWNDKKKGAWFNARKSSTDVRME